MVSRDSGAEGPARAGHPLAEEAAVALVLRGERLATLLCTPRELDDLAVGHLLSRGYLGCRGGSARPSPEALSLLLVCPDRDAVLLDLLGPLPEALEPGSLFWSSCGSGGAVEPPRILPPPVVAGRILPLAGLAAAMRRMFAGAWLHRRGGGVHCAALLEKGELLIREDVGRHNAVDKVLGRALLERRELEGGILLSSGRIALDLVWKAAMAGVGLVASRSIPTTAACALALELGITLVGRCLSASPLVYSGAWRVARN